MNSTFPKFVLVVSTGKIFPFESTHSRVESIGEYWALKYQIEKEANQPRMYFLESFKLQFRVEECIDLNGKSKGVPVITTVAIVDTENKNKFAIQISRNKNQFLVQMNESMPYNIIPISEIVQETSSNHTLYYDQATIINMPKIGQLLATFKSGFSVNFYLAGDNERGLSFIVSASGKQLQNSVGLLVGKPLLRRTVLLKNTETDNSWKVSETERMFMCTMKNPRSVYDQNDVFMHIPRLLNLQIGGTVNPEMKGVIDFLATRNESIGNSARTIYDEFLLHRATFQK